MRGLLFETDDGRLRFLVARGGPTVIVGRRPPPEPQHVTIADDARVSRHHLKIDGELVLEDTSAGGLYLGDGTRVVGPTPLGPGAVLVLHSELRLTARAFEGAYLAAVSPLGPQDGLRLVRDVTRRLLALHAAGRTAGAWGADDVVRAADGSYELLVVNRAPPSDPAADIRRLTRIYDEATGGPRPS